MSDYTERVLRVLVVDDELGMCLGTQKVLRRFQVSVDNVRVNVSFQVDYANTGASFQDMTTEASSAGNPYNLILLDYKLPDCSGTDLLQTIVKFPYPPLVIMITAYATFETAVTATKMGAYDFIPKPFNPEELKNSVKKATIRFILEEQARLFEEERKKMRFQFISVLAHELKAPLNAVEGYVQLMKDRFGKLSEEDYNHMLSRSLERTNAMRKLIFDLLDLTRIESGEKQRNFSLCKLKGEIEKAIELLSFEASKKNIQVFFEAESEGPLEADSSELEIVLNNLISNGIKYNKDNGTLHIKLLETKDQSYKMTFKDSGIGIKEEDRQRLFQDFIRIKNEHTLKISGSGLGLSTVKKICQLYGGDVSLESHYGQGSTFTILLPKERRK